MPKETHTPTPWELTKDNGELNIYGKDGEHIGGWSEDENSPADTQHIVLCVNTHDALVIALEQAIGTVESRDDDPAPLVIKRWKQALAKAKGEKS